MMSGDEPASAIGYEQPPVSYDQQQVGYEQPDFNQGEQGQDTYASSYGQDSHYQPQSQYNSTMSNGKWQPTYGEAQTSLGLLPPGVGPHWMADEEADNCMNRSCRAKFDYMKWKHHCRYCGNIFCDNCTLDRCMLPVSFGLKEPQRVCSECYHTLRPQQDELIRTYSNAERVNSIDLQSDYERYMNSPMRFTLGGEVRKAAYTIQNMIDGIENLVDDKDVGHEIFEEALALVFLTVAKIAFIGGVRFGTGLLVSRLNGGSGWSAPCAVGTMGLSFGAVLGAEVTDMVIPLYDRKALSQFQSQGDSHLMLGGEAGIAFGPVGRNVAAEMHVASVVSHASTISYSHSRGLYGGVTLEGAVVSVRDDVNLKFYGFPVTPAMLFSGEIPCPPAAQPLYDKLAEYEQRMQAHSKAASSRNEGSFAPRT